MLSGDKALQQVFIDMHTDPAKYPDFHSTMAVAVFNLPCKATEVREKYPAMREGVKAITFGINV